MSLLLDALKRAEEAKRAKQSSEQREEPANGEPAAAKPIAVADHASTISDAKALEEMLTPASAHVSGERRPTGRVGRQPLALTLEEMGPTDETAGASEPIPHAIADKSAAPSPKPARASQEIARTVFVAKRPGVMAAAAAKPWLLPAIAILVVSLGAGAWYVWQEVSKLTRSSPATVARSNPQQGAIPLAPMPATTGQSAPAKPPAPGGAEPVQEVALPPLLPPALKDTPAAPAPATSGGSSPLLTAREAFARNLKELPQQPEPPVALKLSQTIQPESVNPELARAYEALRNGDMELARTLYSRRIQADPLSLDAQLGLATVAARLGDRAIANRHYRDALAIDPRNEIAMAGLLAIAGEGSQGNLETRLRTLLSQNPSAASLQFSLGNLLASQNRWVEAQQAYFEAYRLNAELADYAYNLAVSLDHLGQSRLARDYYQKSLALQGRSKGQFDVGAVAKRIHELAGSEKAP